MQASGCIVVHRRPVYMRVLVDTLAAKVCRPLRWRVKRDRCFSRYPRVLSRIISLSGRCVATRVRPAQHSPIKTPRDAATHVYGMLHNISFSLCTNYEIIYVL